MNKFEEWYRKNTDGLHGDEHQAYNHAKRAWKAARRETLKDVYEFESEENLEKMMKVYGYNNS